MFFLSLRRTFLTPVRLFGGILLVNSGGGRSDDVSGSPNCAGLTPFLDYFLPAFFLPATVFFLPLRVRALVCVRWPCTGSPRRCRRPWYEPISTLRLMSAWTSRRRSPSTL